MEIWKSWRCFRTSVHWEYQQKNRTWPRILISVRFNIISTSSLAPAVMWLPNLPHPSSFLTSCRSVFLLAHFFARRSSSHSSFSCCNTLFSSFSAGLSRVFVFVPAFAFRFLTCFFGPSPDYSSLLDWFAWLPDWFPGFNPLLSKKRKKKRKMELLSDYVCHFLTSTENRPV